MYPTLLAAIRDACLSKLITAVTLLGSNTSEIGSMSSSAEEARKREMYIVFESYSESSPYQLVHLYFLIHITIY